MCGRETFMKAFSKLALSREMLQNLKDLNYNTMTPIQKASIPAIFDGRDVLAQAKTGSGKTAAFGLGLLKNLNFDRYRVQGIVLCPTRELAEQVTSELRRLARFKQNIKILTLTGGMPMGRQEQSLKHQVQIVVGTPGRVLKLLERDTLSFDELKMVVLDEADHMLNMGFLNQIESILDYAPKSRQTLCFSATFPDAIKNFCDAFLNNHKEISVDQGHTDQVIQQHFYKVENQQKSSTVLSLLTKHNPESVLIFCNTKDTCKKLGTQLASQGLYCLALHGDLEQKDRTEVLIRFANVSSKVLIATYVAARGLDIDSLSAVINYDLPFETETYVHRIGRTGRAGKEGLAFSFVEPKEQHRLDAINEFVDGNFKTKSPNIGKPGNLKQLLPQMVTLSINGGRKNKISPKDILGALTAKDGIKGSQVGKIDRLDNLTFVAVSRKVASQALDLMQNHPIKGRKFKALRND